MFILDRIDRELRSLKCWDLEIGLSSEFSKFFWQNSRLQTVVFFSKSVKKSVKRGVRVLRTRSSCEAREKKPTVRIFGVSPSLALCSQPRSRPFVWLLALLEHAKIRTVLQSNKIPVRILLDVLFRVFRFSKASFLPWHLHSWHFKTSSPSWHWDVRKGCHGNWNYKLTLKFRAKIKE